MELTRIKKGTRALGLFGWEFRGTAEEWWEYKNTHKLYQAELHGIGRKPTTVLVFPDGREKVFSENKLRWAEAQRRK